MLAQEHIIHANTLWNYHCRVDEIKPSVNSVIIGLGSYDIRVAQYCSKLYLEQMGQKIIFTGKDGNWTRGQINLTEAEIFTAEAIKFGVPASDILLEKEATNIGDNIILSKALVKKYQLKIEQIILVTKPNTTRRAYATFMRYWPELSTKLRVSAPLVKFEDVSPTVTMESLVSELVGDIERIIAYPQQGFQIEQTIPHEVFAAYQYLKAEGYTSHCLKST